MKKKSAFSTLMYYAGSHKYLIYASCILAALSALIALIPFYDVWRIMKEVLEVRPDFSAAVYIKSYGWQAVGFALLSMVIYIAGLMCSHKAAFRVQATMRTVMMEYIMKLPLGYVESQRTGKIRKIVADSSAATETYLAHNLPDKAVSMATPVGLLIMMAVFDWRLGLICMIFPPISYIIAEKMKVVVQKTGAEYKVQSGRLSTATLDRAENAVTYRVYGCEQERKQAYEDNLTAYEKSAVRANIWGTAFPPIYKVIALGGVIFILYFGSRNVLGTGWKSWDIAALATFVSCFAKLSEKSSHAAKLFNAVHKAQVSWKRIKPLMKHENYENADNSVKCDTLEVKGLTFAYPGGSDIFENVTFEAEKGSIIGVTGSVACGKSTLGKVFLCEYPYEGSIKVEGNELAELDDTKKAGLVGYLGHDPELFNDTVKNNIQLGDNADTTKFLKAVCFDEEVNEMENGQETLVGNTGVRLSGGQAQRLALARTLCHKKPLIILDDPFSALDKDTERKVFANLKEYTKDCIVILISHRLYLFPQMDKVIWMENGKTIAGTHDEIMNKCPQYEVLYNEQNGGASDEE